SRPCPAAVKIKFFRLGPPLPRGPTPLQSFAERGPFDVTALTQSVLLSPAVEVQPGDSIAIVRVAMCGNPMAQSPGPGFFYAFAGDVTSDIPGISFPIFYSGSLSVQATNMPPQSPDPTAIVPVVG